MTNIVYEKAKKYKVSKLSLLSTILCEAPQKGGLYDPEGQSGFFDKKGNKENSWGLPQINLDAHPEVSLEQAQDPVWSIDWTAREFSLGHQRMWTCYKDLLTLGKI